MHDEVEITLIATGFQKANSEEEEKKENPVASARSIGDMGQKKEMPSARSIFSQYAMKSAPVEEKPEVNLTPNNDPTSSRVEVARPSNVPP